MKFGKSLRKVPMDIKVGDLERSRVYGGSEMTPRYVTEYMLEIRINGKPGDVIRKTYRDLDLVKLLVRNAKRQKDVKVSVYELKIEKRKMKGRELIVEES